MDYEVIIAGASFAGLGGNSPRPMERRRLRAPLGRSVVAEVRANDVIRSLAANPQSLMRPAEGFSHTRD